MVEVIPDVNLSFKEYQASLQQNPSNIFYQRVQSRNVSTQQCSFTVSSPNKRSYLLSGAQIEWRFQLQRVTSVANVPTAVAANLVDDRDYLSLKPVLPIANAVSSITTSINGSTNTISQPRRFMEALAMAHVSREEALLHYEAGYPDEMGGQLNQIIPGITWGYNEKDKTMMDNYYDMANRMLRGNDATAAHNTAFIAADIGNNFEIIVTEPVISPPFDCFSKVSKEDMPDWSPWKWMSKVIPNVDRLEIDIQFTKLAASMMYYFWGRSADANPTAYRIIDGAATPAANLLLYWTEVPVSTSIPRSLDLQTYNVREFQDATTNPTNLTAADVTSSLIQLNSVNLCRCGA